MITRGKIPLWFVWNCKLIKNNLWFVSQEYNGIYRFSIDDYHEATLEIQFKEDSYKPELYGYIEEWDNQLILSPLNAKKIAIFDIDTREMKYINLPEEIENEKYLYCKVYNNLAYFIGQYSNVEIIKLDLKTGILQKSDCIPNKIIGIDDKLLIGCIETFDNKILISIKNIILEYNMVNGLCKILNINNEISEQISTIWNNNGKILIAFEHQVCEWIPATNKFKKIVNLFIKQIYKIICNDEFIYIFDFSNPYIFIYKFLNKTINKIDLKHNRYGNFLGLSYVLPIFLNANKLLCFSLFSNEVLFIKGMIIRQRFKLFTYQIPQINYKSEYNTCLNKENSYYHTSLYDFLDYILLADFNEYQNEKTKNGDKIYTLVLMQKSNDLLV